MVTSNPFPFHRDRDEQPFRRTFSTVEGIVSTHSKEFTSFPQLRKEVNHPLMSKEEKEDDGLDPDQL